MQDEDGDWWWEPTRTSTSTTTSLVSLHNPDDPHALQELVAAHRNDMLDRDRPLWQSIWIRRFGEGSAMILRSHHAIADGIRMVQLAMSLFDATPQGGLILAPASIQPGSPPHPPGQPLAQRVRTGAAEVARTAGSAVSRVNGAPELFERAGRLGRFSCATRWVRVPHC